MTQEQNLDRRPYALLEELMMIEQRSAWLASIVCGSCIAASAQAQDGFPQIMGGELIFQQMKGPEGEALRRATGGVFTHVGIVRRSGGGPYVVEATAETGVFEQPIEDFIASGVGRKYAIYRVDGVTRDPAWYHPSVLGAMDYFGYDYDLGYLWGGEELYGSELVWRGYDKAGLRLGAVQTFGDLDVRSLEVRDWLFDRWRAEGACADLEWKACWSVMKDEKFVAASSIASDPHLRLLKSTFDMPVPGQE